MPESSAPDFEQHFREGVEHFNARRFWDAHESWETIWLESKTEMHQFLQGLIQLAAAYHHVQRGTLRGAVRLFDAGLSRLAAFPATTCGIQRDALESVARAHRAWAENLVSPTPRSQYRFNERLLEEDFPQIELTSDWSSRIPRGEW